MRLKSLLSAALLFAVPLFSQSTPLSVLDFSLEETKDDVLQRLGRPALIADFGADFSSWQYQIDTTDNHEFSHHVTFRKSSSSVISITRNYETAQDVAAIFPAAGTSTHHFPASGKTQFSILLRQLPGDRVLMAMGVSGPGRRTNQLVLMRKSGIRVFYPWLFEQLEASGRGAAK